MLHYYSDPWESSFAWKQVFLQKVNLELRITEFPKHYLDQIGQGVHQLGLCTMYMKTNRQTEINTIYIYDSFLEHIDLKRCLNHLLTRQK